MQRASWLIFGLLIVGCSAPLPAPRSAADDADAAFTRLADEYLAGYLAWRPQTGTALGFHEYDGKVTDYSQAFAGRRVGAPQSHSSSGWAN